MNIYEQAVKQAEIDKQQSTLDRQVEFELLKSKENLLLEKLDSLGIRYDKSVYYSFNEEDFVSSNRFRVRYNVYLYPNKVKDRRTWEMKYLTKEIQLKRNGGYTFDSKDYNPSSYDLDTIMKSVVESIMKAAKYNINNKQQEK